MSAPRLAMFALAILTAEPNGRPSQSEVDKLVEAVLYRVLTVADYLPCRNLLAEDAPIPLDAEVEGPGFLVTKRALGGSTRWSLHTFLELQSQANATQKGLHYVVISAINLDGDTASLQVGVAQATPTPDGGRVIITCCCVRRDLYEITPSGSWRFSKRMNEGCWPFPPASEVCR